MQGTIRCWKKIAPGRRSLILPYGLDKNPAEGIVIDMKAECKGNVIRGLGLRQCLHADAHMHMKSTIPYLFGKKTGFSPL